MMVGFCFFFFNDTATTEIYTLSLHDALPISRSRTVVHDQKSMAAIDGLLALIEMQKASGLVLVTGEVRSEEHTSELQSRLHLVCRLLLEKKKCRRVPPRPCYY